MTAGGQKRQFPAEHVINWYIGNYLESPSNALRDDWVDDLDSYEPVWKGDIEQIRSGFRGKSVTHSGFLQTMAEIGMHSKYYRYRRFAPERCELCRRYGIG